MNMDTLLAFLIGFAITLGFVRVYLRSLQRVKAAVPAGGAAPAVAGRPCPRCSRPVPQGSSFCGSCGAPMGLWEVHRAGIAPPSNGADAGKPRPVINASICIGCGSCVSACPESGALGLSGGKSTLLNPAACTGHAKCADACPTSALSLARGNVLRTLRVPLVNENFETNVEGLFIAGELGGMGLIKTAINEGRLAAEAVRRRLEELGIRREAPHGNGEPGSQAEGEPFDIAVVGAGPAGLSASLTAQQYGLRYVTLEQGEVATTIRNYPRHKFLMAEPVEMPLYGSLYVGDGAKESLLGVWEAIIANTGVRIRTNERVEEIRRDPALGCFALKTPGGEHRARFVVLAIGKRGVPRKLGVPGEGLGKVAYRLIEAEEYAGKDILVVGGGDSAIEAALGLSNAGRNRVTLSYRGRDFTRARERNQAMLAEREAGDLLTVLRGSQVREISAAAVVLEMEGERCEIPNDFVFVLIGGESPEDFLRKTGIQVVEKALIA
jgi:thioredoxin reductase (NADPH)